MKENTFLKRSKILEDNQDYLIDSVRTISQVFIEVINKGGKLIFAGNGGSAAGPLRAGKEVRGEALAAVRAGAFRGVCLRYGFDRHVGGGHRPDL